MTTFCIRGGSTECAARGPGAVRVKSIAASALLPALLFLLGCGAEYQQTPEPKEAERVNELVQKLGVQRSWNAKTLAPNPKPDGLVLMQWMDRRKATLNGTLPLTQLPAVRNPGSVGATLAWERHAEEEEAETGQALTNYMLDFETRKGRCPLSSGAEYQWYVRQRDAHAEGLPSTLIDWAAVNQSFAARCEREASAIAARAAVGQRAAEVTEAQLIRDQLACTAPWEQANAAYLDAPSTERGAAVTAAAEARNACISSLERRYGRSLNR